MESALLYVADCAQIVQKELCIQRSNDKHQLNANPHLVTLYIIYDVSPKSNENDFKKNLPNIHAITVYPLQNRLLVIEYSDSSVAATLHSSGGSLHLRCCSKPSSQLPGRFQLSQNDVLLRWVLSFGNKKKMHGAKSGLYSGWGSVVI